MKAIRVLIADDHPLILEGLAASLEQAGITIAGRETNVDQIIPSHRKLEPDVLVLDIRFGAETSGLDVARELLRETAQAKIVFYSQYDQLELVREAYKLGGLGFVTKQFEADVLIEAIQVAVRGEAHFMPQMLRKLAVDSVQGDHSPQALLDQRELQVFKLIAHGRTVAQVASKMDLSSRTINVITQAIKQKLHVQKPVEMTRLAIKHGLLPTDI